MSDKSNIEWTDATWNPIVGCSIVSPGCTNCYAMKMAARIERMGGAPHYDGTTQDSKAGAVWTGKVAQASDHILTAPLRWKRGRRIFVNSMGDLFHESIPDEWIDRVFAVMALCPQHTFQVLTKRAQRMLDYMVKASNTPSEPYTLDPKGFESVRDDQWRAAIKRGWPLDNVWLGVSCERQQEADERIPLLLQTPAAVRFISAEPLLGPIDLTRIPVGKVEETCGTIDWIIVGGESGPNARPMNPDWARMLRDQQALRGSPFFFKQWGEFAPVPVAKGQFLRGGKFPRGAKRFAFERIEGAALVRFGKKGSGRMLDGCEHNAMPQAAALRSPVMTDPQNAEAAAQ